MGSQASPALAVCAVCGLRWTAAAGERCLRCEVARLRDEVRTLRIARGEVARSDAQATLEEMRLKTEETLARTREILAGRGRT